MFKVSVFGLLLCLCSNYQCTEIIIRELKNSQNNKEILSPEKIKSKIKKIKTMKSHDQQDGGPLSRLIITDLTMLWLAIQSQ